MSESIFAKAIAAAAEELRAKIMADPNSMYAQAERLRLALERGRPLPHPIVDHDPGDEDPSVRPRFVFKKSRFWL